MSGPNDLSRFLDAQDAVYTEVLEELREGRKQSHWMWFIFPQISGLGRSEYSQHFAIGSIDEAVAYSKHPILGRRLRACIELVLLNSNKSAVEIFGQPDDLKFRSCLTLFNVADDKTDIYQTALDQFFDGERDPLTLAQLDQ